MVQDGTILTVGLWQTSSKSYIIYRTAPFSMTLNQDFKVTPLFDAEYLRIGTIYRYSAAYNECVNSLLLSLHIPVFK